MKPENLAYPYGVPVISGLIKSRPEDFEVIEHLDFEPSEQGEHLFLLVEKTGLTTPQLIEIIARQHALHPRQIGYSGLKDRNALTRQWLSLHLPGRELPEKPRDGEGYRVLRAHRHYSKLRHGTHKSNFFRVTLRQVAGLEEVTREQLQALATRGMANYFGPQRFGREQDNVEQALKQLGNARLKRSRRGILLSSLRSYLFNQVLSRRISLGHWDQPLDGDVFMLRGSHSIFSEPLDQSLRQRFSMMDIASTASLYGSGESRLSGEALQIEQRILAEHEEVTACLDRQAVRRQMRALRVALDTFDYEHDPVAKTMRLQVSLPAGSYLTSLLAHFIAVSEPAQEAFRYRQNQPSDGPSR
ncbi:MAG: tRNA pseudouridine(13) synthase TruD [Gammaproteobacteria bacterium]|nr:MAG: tRNA pseudouridine(13) synthase TruD [Gammaproteobacteria bacterium]